VRDYLAAEGIEATVTHVPPLVPTDYEQLDMRCPHGVLWYTEPTSDQIAKWVAEGVR
jgi:ATP-dependent Zn protease